MGVFRAFNQFFKKNLNFPQASETYRSGVDTMNSGLGISDSAINGLNSDIGGYQDQIASGGLTPALRSQFNVARASVLDRSTAQRTGLRSGLAQRAAEAGGALSPAAIAELEAGGNEEIGQGEFGATNDVNAQEAQLGFQATQANLDRINQARQSILGAGNYRAGLGANLRGSALDVMLRRRQAIASTIVSATGTATGGGGFH